MDNFASESPLILTGIDGGNPLGFLAAVGTAILSHSFCKKIRFYWRTEAGVWRPALLGCTTGREAFVAKLFDAAKSVSMEAFEIDNKLPFSVEVFESSLKDVRRVTSPSNRRMADFLVAFGSEISPKNGVFRDSRFRMVRSGDSKGQGLPVYVRLIRRLTTEEKLYRSLFMSWTYKDIFYEELDRGKKKKKNVPNFRWDPIDDRRYALRWSNPDQKTDDDVGIEIGASSLALEALQWYPTMFRNGQLETTGFHRNSKKEVWFTWPIWECPLSLDSLRSLLALSELHCEEVPRSKLAKRGIVEIYRSQRIQQNQYYSNFTSARPA